VENGESGVFLKALSVLFASVAVVLLFGAVYNQHKGRLVVRVGRYLVDGEGVSYAADPLTFIKAQMFNVSMSVCFGLGAFVFWILPTK